MQVVDDLLRAFQGESRDENLPATRSSANDDVAQMILRGRNVFVLAVPIRAFADQRFDRRHRGGIADNREHRAAEITGKSDTFFSIVYWVLGLCLGFGA